MYDFYGVYASCRDAAWRCLRDFRVGTLPVSLVSIARCAGISVKKNSLVNELREGEYGAGLCISGKWIIVYDDSMDRSRARFVVAHELGHIFLGHEYKYSERRFVGSDKKIKSEREADMFAIRLLAPACVLHELGAVTAEDIAIYCDIPIVDAQKRARRMRTLESRSCFYLNRLEREVADGFKAFIAEKKLVSKQNLTGTE